MQNRQYYTYIATNKLNTVLYTGVTNKIIKRMYEHKNGFVSSFTSMYKIIKLVYFEVFNNINEAIAREKQIKAGSRKKKIELIKKMNPNFEDLYDRLF